MLEGLKGDAGEVTHLTQAAALDTPTAGLDSVDGLGQPAAATTVRRTDTPAALDTGRSDGPRVRELPARPGPTDSSAGVRRRLQAAYAQQRPNGQPWTARTLAEAAGCSRSSAAAFLQTQRTAKEDER
jgi:hypothetical protein